ncbi:NlpC/P60 family protein [Clostridium chromiireducens]|uniref:C40 family peptidase n=1 Tax=Clostridium chromiireducens TaxID=225345 RepID=UPI003AF8B76A
MKKRIISLVLVIVMTLGSSISAFAAPDNAQLSESRQKYTEIENRIKDIESKVDELSAQIEPLQVAVDKNKREIENINNIIENTKKDINQCKKEINDLDLALGQRVKAMYNSGDLEFNYVNFVLKADSSGEFFSRIQAVTEIVGKDKLSIENIENKKNELNSKVKSLDDKKNEINKLTKEIQDDLSELDKKKRDQQALAEQAKVERSKFDAEYLSQLEREAVKSQFDTIDSSSSTYADVQGAISQLISIRDNQIKSPIIIKEINSKLDNAKVIASQKKAAEEKQAAERERQAQAQAKASNTIVGTKKPNTTVSPRAAGNAQAVLNEAYKHLGTPYVWGATGPDTFDCSGFTSYVYRNAAGIDISRTTYTQIDVGQSVSRDELKPGDLVFPNPGHVGIYVGNGQMIHAPQTGDVVKVGPVYNFYAARRIL